MKRVLPNCGEGRFSAAWVTKSDRQHGTQREVHNVRLMKLRELAVA